MKKSRNTGKVMFSEVSGRVLLDGKPVVNREIRQDFTWLGVDGGDVTTHTDDDGRYRFPAVVSHQRRPRRDTDVFISQRISIVHEDRTITLWSTTKYEFEDGGELGGYPISLVHELTGESRRYMIPGLGEYPTNLEGVLELDHPYVHDLARGEVLVSGSREVLIHRMVTVLNTPDMLALINAQLVHPVLFPSPVRAVEEIAQVELSSFSLYGDAEHAEISATGYRYIGFTIGGRLALRDAADAVCQVPLYWPGASVALVPPVEGPPSLEGNLKTLHVYPGDIYWDAVGRHLRRESVADLVYHLITTRPTAELAYMFDRRLDISDLVYRDRGLPRRYVPEYGISEFAIDSVSPSFVKVEDDYLSVKVTGRVAVDGHPSLYRFTAYLCLALGSLGEGGCRLVENGDCRFSISIPDFAYAIGMDSPVVSKGDPVLMHFTVTNRLPKTNVFLVWHTPLEGFRNEFLKIVHVESGEEVPYEGMLASRAAPSRENGSYLELGAGASKTATIDLREAYTFSRAGTYRVAFRPLGGGVEEEPTSTQFLLTEPVG